MLLTMQGYFEAEQFIADMPIRIPEGRKTVVLQNSDEALEDKLESSPPKADYAALDKLCGSLHEYANPARIAGEKNAWQAAVIEKAANMQYAL